MALTIGTQLGSYEITALLGKGGMGEVYRARDLKLKREVAIKILPEEFSRDTDRVSRFQREAEVLASLNHPNIAAIYDLEEANETQFLVLELVAGETLAERIQRAPIPVEEALVIAKHICEALEAAHERAVVHRDLKPGNVKITPEGKVKVLDFGLAKAMEATRVDGASNSPTLLSAAATNGGMILGTAGYMSPEQAKGYPVDQRSDIFSFGCVLHEMLTGRQTFQADTVTETIAAVLMREPDLKALPANLHPKTEDLIRRCLAKNRKDRWHAIADVRVELESIMADPHGAKLRAAHGADRRPLWKRGIPIAVTALLVAAGTSVVDRIMRPAPSLSITRFSLVLPADQRFTTASRRTVAISPDGTNVVYVANDQLYLRSLNELKARSIQSQRGIASPFFSPDGHSVGFFVSEAGEVHLKRIPITGGSAVTICRIRQVATSTWSTDDQIFIGDRDGVFRVNANGGQPEMVVTVQPGETAYGPQLLPGGEFLLFTITSPDINILERWDKAKIVVQSLKSGSKPKVVLEGGADAQYVPTGHLVYAHSSTLFAVPFDLKTLQVKGGAVPIVEGVQRAANTIGTVQFSFSSNGSMIYVPGASDAEPTERSIALVDRAGNRRLLDVTEPGMYNHPRISPGGTQLALDVDGKSGRNIWIHDLTGKTAPRQLTFEGSSNNRPTWTRDDNRIVFTSDREREGSSIFSQSADGKGQAELLVRADPGKTLQPESWSKDNSLTFSLDPGTSHSTIWLFSPSPSLTKKLLIDSPKGSVTNTTISPDGRWVAYWSSESGGGDIYVRPFPPDGGTRHRISTSSNTHYPLWSPNGKQLFYVIDQPGGTGQIVSVDIQTEPTFAVIGKPTPLPIQGIVFNGPRGYDVTPDGKYFVVMLPKSQVDPTKEAPPEQINMTLNWFEELKQRVPVH